MDPGAQSLFMSWLPEAVGKQECIFVTSLVFLSPSAYLKPMLLIYWYSTNILEDLEAYD